MTRRKRILQVVNAMGCNHVKMIATQKYTYALCEYPKMVERHIDHLMSVNIVLQCGLCGIKIKRKVCLPILYNPYDTDELSPVRSSGISVDRHELIKSIAQLKVNTYCKDCDLTHNEKQYLKLRKNYILMRNKNYFESSLLIKRINSYGRKC